MIFSTMLIGAEWAILRENAAHFLRAFFSMNVYPGEAGKGRPGRRKRERGLPDRDLSGNQQSRFKRANQ
ncbi:hypothetical protein [Bacillus sp. M6-12]|uniref:hypothetical protein n=1 Tax=Bacillus sp. M6-12 TaxID=2054166 RepID=UPI00115887B2|nr:hypothetical protein [Bacillus sp. M6-12]